MKKSTTTISNIAKESIGASDANPPRVDVDAHENTCTVEQPSRVRVPDAEDPLPAPRKLLY